ncbi:sensor histidine kinase [Salipaludibacillus keqinensis]|uniref:histidine kinase n=1 Tax=Salipaludibacillus keqinensis TaxID=2045207 RepID=A0A323TJF8_9BACI|nr:sensor histidine kinase [Salipaludibacillus keqinensis]PYZ94998.1 sensor histidine kinase [Salipaludibacillus keqinensis]
MRYFWVWFGLLFVTWIIALSHGTNGILDHPFNIALSAVFFTLYFLLPLFNKNKFLQMVLLSCMSVGLTVIFWPHMGGEANPYPLILTTMILGEAVYRLRSYHIYVVASLLLVGLYLPAFLNLPSLPPIFLTLYSLFLAMMSVIYYKSFHRERELADQHEALLTEFRKLKRAVSAGESMARREERTQIAREIHDSVGHKLTALLMQLEVYRMQANEENASEIASLKQLAKDSLEETRSAVKALKKDEVGGLGAIIRLIRKLEAESFLQVHFSVKHGALSAPLRNDQSIAVYRAVQEALTNMMRHSETKDVMIMFESLGGTVFRFEVSHRTTKDISFREGFGITSMRERIEQAGGTLNVRVYDGRFIVEGILPVVAKEVRSGD